MNSMTDYEGHNYPSEFTSLNVTQ